MVRKLKVQDRTILLLIEIAEAKLSAARGQTASALAQLTAVIKRSKEMKLPVYEFEARLAKVALAVPQKNEAGLRELAKEADAKGFKLIARKAREAANH